MDLEYSFSLLSGWCIGKSVKQKLSLDRINKISRITLRLTVSIRNC